MANINTELEQIRKAVYGREVRGSIANAIELINKEQVNTSTAQTSLDNKFNQLIINAGNSNAEVVASRVKADGTQFDTLGKRLDKSDEVHNALNNEVISSRTDSKNVVHKNLKARLDKFDLELDTIVKNKTNKINVKNYFNVTENTNNLSYLLQTYIDGVTSEKTLYFERGVTYKFENKVKLNKYVVIECENNDVVLKSLKDGVFYTDDSTPFIKIKYGTFEGSGNVGEYGLNFRGGNSGNAKLILEDILVKGFGEDGIKLVNCWDSALDNVNVSSNKGNGITAISCFSTHFKKIVAWRNEKKGIYLQDASGSLFNGTSQENGEEGVLSESSLGCTYQMYLEQNGFRATIDNNKSQFRLTQKLKGEISNGNTLNIYAIGGKGTDMESKYGVYIDYARNTILNGEFFNHTDTDVYFSSNSYDNEYFGNRENRPNGTPKSVVNNGKNRYDVKSKNGAFIQTISSESSGSGIKTISYPMPLNKIPLIIGTINSGPASITNLSVKVGNKTTTGFDFTVTDGTQFKDRIVVNFLIIEE